MDQKKWNHSTKFCAYFQKKKGEVCIYLLIIFFNFNIKWKLNEDLTFSYGFIHFVDEETKINFFEEVDGKKFKIGQESEEELTIHFFPLVRKKQVEHVILIYFFFKKM